MNIAYFDCLSGISCDRALGALMDLGVPVEALMAEVRTLPPRGWTIETSRERRGAIEGMRICVGTGREQPCLHLADVRRILDAGKLDPWVKGKCGAVFERLAEAEGKVRGMPSEAVPFHEIESADLVLQVVGTFFCLRYLKVDKILASPIPLGGGFMETRDGMMPLPRPVTSLLLTGVPVVGANARRELVPPSGAALIGALTESFGPIPPMELVATGYGAGALPSGSPPDLLRVFLGRQGPSTGVRDLLLLETNIDDMNPEFYNYVSERLFALGALDVSLTAVQMKKNRPGVMIQALIEPSLESAAAELILTQTTTLGVRVREVRRIELRREVITVSSVFGPCKVKRVLLPNGQERLIPEYEECRRIAGEKGVPIPDVYRGILLSAKKGEE